MSKRHHIIAVGPQCCFVGHAVVTLVVVGSSFLVRPSWYQNVLGIPTVAWCHKTLYKKFFWVVP